MAFPAAPFLFPRLDWFNTNQCSLSASGLLTINFSFLPNIQEQGYSCLPTDPVFSSLINSSICLTRSCLDPQFYFLTVKKKISHHINWGFVQKEYVSRLWAENYFFFWRHQTSNTFQHQDLGLDCFYRPYIFHHVFTVRLHLFQNPLEISPAQRNGIKLPAV